MGKRGPLPKPTTLKRLEGNRAHRPLPKFEPEPPIDVEIPSPPDHLTEIGKDVWNYVGKQLHVSGVLTTVDYHALEMYAVSYSTWRKMLAEVDEVGFVEEYYNPDGSVKYTAPKAQVGLALKYMAECARWAKVLGLGPAFRVGLIVDEAQKKLNVADPFAARICNAG